MSSFLIAISGPTAAGKTFFTEQLVRTIDNADMSNVKISTDEFYKDLSHLPMSERVKVNYDLPESIEIDYFYETMVGLSQGKEVEIPVYNFSTHTRKDDTRRIKPVDVVIVEGIFSLSFEEINQIYDLKIFIDLDQDLRLIRRVRRDIKERGRDVESVFRQYLQQVRPSQDEYVLQDREKADFLLLGDQDHTKVLELLKLAISSKISQHK